MNGKCSSTTPVVCAGAGKVAVRWWPILNRRPSRWYTRGICGCATHRLLFGGKEGKNLEESKGECISLLIIVGLCPRAFLVSIMRCALVSISDFFALTLCTWSVPEWVHTCSSERTIGVSGFRSPLLPLDSARLLKTAVRHIVLPDCLSVCLFALLFV
ncbi:hypothetical protein BDQ94DRAFT_28089 [Aspergillus welwitschiae]|uniref:Uncharacterized protein n=1 Tax=Aspergillus welwitschiae TaxID=1341132 RepID=A0A3F3Q440_9EURO|nr:hypothetical protein BDQ94DRAFT_28089 [Aspergillus welwitschiae]RDH33969.1 hypothetical protein BDQ94DRAFT_28089 [Aspergillus welwitschiae]